MHKIETTWVSCPELRSGCSWRIHSSYIARSQCRLRRNLFRWGGNSAESPHHPCGNRGAAGVSVATVSRVSMIVPTSRPRRVDGCRNTRDSDYRPAGSIPPGTASRADLSKSCFPSRRTPTSLASGRHYLLGSGRRVRGGDRRVLSPDSSLINPKGCSRSERAGAILITRMPPHIAQGVGRRRLSRRGCRSPPARGRRMHHHRCDQLHRRSHGC